MSSVPIDGITGIFYATGICHSSVMHLRRSGSPGQIQNRHAKSPSAAKSLEFFRWDLNNGAPPADARGYTPLPAELVKLIEPSWPKAFQEAKAPSSTR
jgi:hypothetical protein